MNIITTGAAPQTMTSREIAETVGSAHESVLKTIRRLRAEGIVSGNETPYTHEQNGQTYTEFCLTYRDTMVVASGYSAELRAKVIDRWMELEARVPARVMSAGEMFLQNAQAMVAMEKTIAEQGNQIASQAEAIKRIESNQAAAVASVQSFTALGFSIFREIPMSAIELNRLGRRASAISKKKGITIDHVADGRHGRVGSYHVSVLDEALEELMK
jgi:phage regulator Rha-like protein